MYKFPPEGKTSWTCSSDITNAFHSRSYPPLRQANHNVIRLILQCHLFTSPVQRRTHILNTFIIFFKLKANIVLIFRQQFVVDQRHKPQFHSTPHWSEEAITQLQGSGMHWLGHLWWDKQGHNQLYQFVHKYHYISQNNEKYPNSKPCITQHRDGAWKRGIKLSGSKTGLVSGQKKYMSKISFSKRNLNLRTNWNMNLATRILS